MGSKRLVLNVAIVILLVLALMFSYKRGWLNPVLPAKWREQHPGPLKSGFVGDTGRYPAMQKFAMSRR